MKKKLIYLLKFTGFLFLMFICIFFLIDLLVMVGFNQGFVTAEVAAIFLVTLIPLIFIYKRTRGFSTI